MIKVLNLNFHLEETLLDSFVSLRDQIQNGDALLILRPLEFNNEDIIHVNIWTEISDENTVKFSESSPSVLEMGTVNQIIKYLTSIEVPDGIFQLEFGFFHLYNSYFSLQRIE
jgi:hypothetical protein